MSWATGALLSLFGSTAGNLGINCQKYSLTLEGRKPQSERRPFYKQKRYCLGLALIIFGSLGDFAALSMVAQSVIAPLGSFTLVANICFAHFWLHEYVGWRELIGTALIITGSVLSVVFGNHSDPTYTNQQLLDLISGGLFISYAVVFLSLILCGVILHFRLTPLKAKLVELEAAANPPPAPPRKASVSRDALSPMASSSHRTSSRSGGAAAAHAKKGSAPAPVPTTGFVSSGALAAPTSPPTPELASRQLQSGHVHVPDHVLHHLSRVDSIANLDTGAAAVTLVPTEEHKLDLTELPALRQRWSKWSKFHPFMLAALSGIVGAQSVLFSKCFSVLFATTVDGDNQLNNIFPWVCFILMLICIFSQLYFMTQALGFYDSLYVVPVFQVFFIFTSAAGGAAYFREVHSFTTMQTIMFPVGFAITLAGVAVLTFRSKKEKIQQMARKSSREAAAAAAGAPKDTTAAAARVGTGQINGSAANPQHSPGGFLTRDSTSDDGLVPPELDPTAQRIENEAAAGLAVRVDSRSGAGMPGAPGKRLLNVMKSPVSDLESYHALGGGRHGDDGDGALDLPAHTGRTPIEALIHAAQEQKAPTYARSPNQDSETRQVVFHDLERREDEQV